jgi:hypothetical protein
MLVSPDGIPLARHAAGEDVAVVAVGLPPRETVGVERLLLTLREVVVLACGSDAAALEDEGGTRAAGQDDHERESEHPPVSRED